MNKICHVIWNSFSFHFIKTKKQKQKHNISGIQVLYFLNIFQITYILGNFDGDLKINMYLYDMCSCGSVVKQQNVVGSIPREHTYWQKNV